jgi:hypothetical protein
MSEPLAERLSAFTPDGSGLDRDGLLFAAGKASARPNTWWVALAGLLAAGQVATLVWLWPKPPPRVVTPAPVVAPAPAEPDEHPAPAPPPESSPAPSMVDRRRWTEDAESPRPAPARSLVPDAPPLHAFAASTPLPAD